MPVESAGEASAEKFREGVMLFNSGEFFKAHEVWEALWLTASEPDKTFLQGIIQSAAAFHHHARGNRSGARSLLVAALEKLGNFPGHYRGVNLAAFRASCRVFLSASPAVPACVPSPPPQIPFV